MKRGRKLSREFFRLAAGAGFLHGDDVRLAEHIGVSPVTVRHWRKEQHIPLNKRVKADMGAAMELWREAEQRRIAERALAGNGNGAVATVRAKITAPAVPVAPRLAGVQYEGGLSFEFPKPGVVEVTVPDGTVVTIKHRRVPT